VLVREYQGKRHTVTVVPGGYVWRENTYASLSTIARAITGTAWNGPRFFGLRTRRDQSEVPANKIVARGSRHHVVSLQYHRAHDVARLSVSRAARGGFRPDAGPRRPMGGPSNALYAGDPAAT